MIFDYKYFRAKMAENEETYSSLGAKIHMSATNLSEIIRDDNKDIKLCDALAVANVLHLNDAEFKRIFVDNNLR